MKLITAIIPPARLEATKIELGKVNVVRMTIAEVQGLPEAPPSPQSAAAGYSASTDAPRPERFLKIVIAVNEDFVEPTLHAILRAAELKSLSQSFGRIFVTRLEQVVRVRTGERGPAAI